MALTALGIVAALGAAGSQAYAASQANKGAGGSSSVSNTRVGTPYVTGGQSYLARLMALNSGWQPGSFTDYVKSGGTAVGQLQGAGQFTPLEAQRLNMVGANNEPVPFFKPGEQNRLTNEQELFLGSQLLAKRKLGQRKGPMTPAETYTQLEEDIRRANARLTRGTLKPAAARQSLARLNRNIQLRDRLHESLFGAPYTPQPWATDPTTAESLGAVAPLQSGETSSSESGSDPLGFLPGEGILVPGYDRTSWYRQGR